MKALKEKESDIVRAICEYLALKRHFFWRQNTAPTFDWKTNSFRAMPKYSLRGVPDIIVIDDTGHFIGLEVKRAGGKLSPDQVVFQELCKKHGAEYHMVQSIADCKELGL